MSSRAAGILLEEIGMELGQAVCHFFNLIFWGQNCGAEMEGTFSLQTHTTSAFVTLIGETSHSLRVRKINSDMGIGYRKAWTALHHNRCLLSDLSILLQVPLDLVQSDVAILSSLQCAL